MLCQKDAGASGEGVVAQLRVLRRAIANAAATVAAYVFDLGCKPKKEAKNYEALFVRFRWHACVAESWGDDQMKDRQSRSTRTFLLMRERKELVLTSGLYSDLFLLLEWLTQHSSDAAEK